MKLRFIMRDGKRILQSHPGKFGDWTDVPLVEEPKNPLSLWEMTTFPEEGVVSFPEQKAFWHKYAVIPIRADLITNGIIKKVGRRIVAPVTGTYWIKKKSYPVEPGNTYYFEVWYYPGDRDISDELVDGPKIIDQTAPTEPTEQDFELEVGYEFGPIFGKKEKVSSKQLIDRKTAIDLMNSSSFEGVPEPYKSKMMHDLLNPDSKKKDIEDLESGEYRMGLRTVTFSRCIHNDPTCHCRES